MAYDSKQSAKLLVLKEGVLVSEHWLKPEPLSIGRHPDCDVQVHDPGVSAWHARVTPVLDDFFLEDLESTNGSTLNGMPVKRRILVDGDEIAIGSHALRYERTEAGQAGVAKTLMFRAPRPAPHSPGTDRTARPAQLRFMNGRDKHRTITLAKSRTVLGCAGQQVAVISRRPQGYVLSHAAGITRGSGAALINGRATATGGHQLRDGDQIQLGRIRLRFIEP